jgi:LuxR family transcriptional regulator, transcriptional regulator of spore coat protein
VGKQLKALYHSVAAFAGPVYPFVKIKIWGRFLSGRLLGGQEGSDSKMLTQKILANEPVLTPREREILELVAQGLSTKQVAQNIDIAPRTVDRHVENMRLKLRAKNRSHMVACAVVGGFLDVPHDDHDAGVRGALADLSGLVSKY